MGWIADVLNIRAALTSGPFAGEDGERFSGLFPAGRPNPPTRGTDAFLRSYSTMPWLRAVTGRVATSVASVSWKVSVVRRRGRAVRHHALQTGSQFERPLLCSQLRQAGELVELDEHPLLDLLNDPNPMLEGIEARKLTQIYLDVVGETFWVLGRNGLGMPVQAWPLPPTWVRSTPNAERPFFEVQLPGFQGPIPESEIVWFSDPDPVNPYGGRGSGTARALADELETDEFAAKHTKAFFYNRARPDLLVNVEGASAVEAKRIQQDWMSQNQGFWRAFRPFFINRRLDVHELGQSFSDIQLTDLRKQERDTIIEVFGVPPEILGIVESSNRATIEAADFLYTRWVVVPRLEKLRAVLQERLVPEFDERLIVDYVSPVQADKEHLLNVATAAPWSISVDEWRELEGREPLAGGAGQVFMVPFSLVPSRIPTGVGTPDDEARAYRPGRRVRELAAGADRRLRVIHAVSDRVAPEMADTFERTVETHRRDIHIGAVEDALAAGDVGVAEDAIEAEDLASTLWGESASQRQAGDSDGTMPRFIRASLQLGAEAAAEDLRERAGIAIDLESAGPAAVSWARSHAAEMVTSVGEQTRRAIRDAIARALEDRVPPYAAAREIRELIGLTNRDAEAVQRLRARLIEEGASDEVLQHELSRAARRALRRRALTIARHETLQAANAGQDLLWEQAVRDGELDPETATREWLTAEDERVDDELCKPMMGQQTHIGEPFDTPAGPVLRPPLHVLCRCTVVLVLEGVTPRAP